MSTKIPVLPLPLSPHQEQLPPLVAHFPRWSRNTPVTSASIILSNGSTSSEFDLPVKNISTVSKGVVKQAESSEKCTTESSSECSAPMMDPYRRINQLEQNIRSLQAQHLIMLTSLHDEIESLRQQNKELQFQLVFKISSSSVASGLQSEDSSGNTKAETNKSCVEVLDKNSKDVEILERKLSTTLASLEEANAKNSHLTAITEDQNLQIAQLSKRSEGIPKGSQMNDDCRAIENQLKDELKSCLSQLEDAERLIQILRKENDEQQSEIKMLKNTSYKGNHNARKNNRNHHQLSQRFPPLMHWQPQNNQNHGEWSARGNSGRSLNSAESLDHRGYQVPVSLPHVQNYGGQNTYYSNSNHHSYNHSRRGSQRNDDRMQNLHAQGYRKHLNGSRRMSQESN